MKHKDIKNRNEDIWVMRKDRYTLREIGEKYGVTKERVRQITEMKKLQEFYRNKENAKTK